MRLLSIGLIPLALACTESEQELRFISTLQSETQGVALSEDGLDSYAAMSGTTCTIDTNWGCPVSDEDLPTEEEHVLDHQDGETLASTKAGLHFLSAEGWEEALDVPLDGVRTARLTRWGPLVLTGTDETCRLRQGKDARAVPGALCSPDADVDVDRELGRLVVATGEGVYQVDLDGVTELDADADLVAQDAHRGGVYVARAGSDTLRALEEGGTGRWVVRTGGAIHSVVSRGVRGEVVTLSQLPDGFGLVERFDGATGERLSETEIPAADGRLLASRNGKTVAIVRDDAVHFYSMLGEGETAPIDETPPTCIEGPTRETRD